MLGAMKWSVIAMSNALALALLLAACGASDEPAVVDASSASDAGVGAFDAGADADLPDAPPFTGDAGPVRRVLFIGNSFTYVADLPGLVRDLAAHTPEGPPLDTSSEAIGSATLSTHWFGAAPARIAEGWDFVVLQGQSVEPVLSRADFDLNADRLAGAARDVGATPVLFDTWARAPGDTFYDVGYVGAGSPDEMQDTLTTVYSEAATRNMGLLAPAGEAFRIARTTAPDLVIYDGDGSHPAPLGSFMTACVIYEVIAGHPPARWAPPTFDPDAAARVCAIGHQAVAAL